MLFEGWGNTDEWMNGWGCMCVWMKPAEGKKEGEEKKKKVGGAREECTWARWMVYETGKLR